MIHVTGSPLSPDAYHWVYQSLPDVWLASVSGGTDVAGIFLGGAPTEPVRVGRLQPPALGVAAAAWNAAGEPVVDEVGELVVTVPMPSMPLRFWDDPDGSRFRASYFETYPGVWRHGDLVEFAPDASSVIVGRSDSTLNRNGIRLGPADLYQVVEALPEVKEAMVVGVEEPEGYFMPLFVELAEGVTEEQAEVAVRTGDPLCFVAAVRAGSGDRAVRHPAHPHGQEAGGAGEADPDGCCGRARSSIPARWTRSLRCTRSRLSRIAGCRRDLGRRADRARCRRAARGRPVADDIRHRGAQCPRRTSLSRSPA